MSSITAVNQDKVTFTTWQGPMRRPQLRGGTGQRLGSGTIVAWTSASRAAISLIEVTIVAIDQVSADIAEKLIQDLQNRACDVTDAHGERFPTCWCHSAELTDKLRGKAIGGEFLIRAKLQLEVLLDQIANDTITDSI